MNQQHMNGQTMQSKQGMPGKQACNNWNDECMMSDLLDTTKHIATQYGSLILEGSTKPLRQILTDNLDETLNDQFQIFEQVQQRGWYQTKAAQQPDVQTAKQKFTQTKNQLM